MRFGKREQEREDDGTKGKETMRGKYRGTREEGVNERKRDGGEE